MMNPLSIRIWAVNYLGQSKTKRCIIPPSPLNKGGKHSACQLADTKTKEERVHYFLLWVLIQIISFIFVFTPFIYASETKINAFVSILPHAYFVERIGGEYVNVRVLVEKGQSPETFNPTPKQVIALQDAQVFFHTGMPFEDAWNDRIQSVNPKLLWVDLRTEIELLDMEDTAINIADGVHHIHHHENKDPHIWLDPLRVIRQLETIVQALKNMDSINKIEYDSNTKKLIKELLFLHQEIEDLLKPTPKKVFALFHPSWGYMADRYGLKQIAIETGGKEPSAKQLGKVIEYIKQHNIKSIFVQEQMDTRLAKTIAHQISGEVITIDPLAKDYINNLRETAKIFAKALQ